MIILVFVEAQVQPGKIVDVKSYLPQIISDTRSYSGCQSIDIYMPV